jgi:hypothetical protein
MLPSVSERVTSSPTCRGRSDRKGSPFPSLGIAVGFVLLALGGVAAPASAHARVSPENAAATHAYLIATVSFEEAELTNLPQSVAAMEGVADRISGECPGVLTGAPPTEQELGLIGSESMTPPGPRTSGERQRQSRQRGDLQLELSLALSDSRIQPDREAAGELIHTLTPLRWSNPKITLLLHLTLANVQDELELPAPPVCADMKAWVASGYRTLSAASKELASQTEALLKHALEALVLYSQAGIQPFPEILARYEGARDRALARHIEALTAELQRRSATEAAVLKRLEAAVGLPAAPVPKVEPPAKKPVVIGRGRTAAGGSFVAKAEPLPHSRRRPRCVNVTVTESSGAQHGGLLELLISGGSERCLTRSHVHPEPTVQCNSGLLTVEANLLPATRSVRLLLSDGRTITSPAIRVPARLGGPAGLYYQAVRGPAPIPVSLIELDAQGRTLTVLKLPAVVECARNPVKYFPGGIVRLAHESLPQGPTFTIRAERYRELGTVHFELNLEVSNELFSGGGGEGLNEVDEGFGTHGGRAFEPQTSTGCQPQPYAIVYGVLKARRDTVLARVAGRLVPLRKVPIPARLHAGGVLAYGAFAPMPTELLIRGPSGTSVSSENLGEAAKSATETCEGEAE